jgi:hypothetical protein
MPIDKAKLVDFDRYFCSFDVKHTNSLDICQFYDFLNAMLVAPPDLTNLPPESELLFGLRALHMFPFTEFTRAETDFWFHAYERDGASSISKASARQIVSGILCDDSLLIHESLFRNLDLDRDSFLSLDEVKSTAQLLGKDPAEAETLLASRRSSYGYSFAAFYFYATGLEIAPGTDPYDFFKPMSACCLIL